MDKSSIEFLGAIAGILGLLIAVLALFRDTFNYQLDWEHSKNRFKRLFANRWLQLITAIILISVFLWSQNNKIKTLQVQLTSQESAYATQEAELTAAIESTQEAMKGQPTQTPAIVTRMITQSPITVTQVITQFVPIQSNDMGSDEIIPLETLGFVIYDSDSVGDSERDTDLTISYDPGNLQPSYSLNYSNTVGTDAALYFWSRDTIDISQYTAIRFHIRFADEDDRVEFFVRSNEGDENRQHYSTIIGFDYSPVLGISIESSQSNLEFEQVVTVPIELIENSITISQVDFIWFSIETTEENASNQKETLIISKVEFVE